MLPADTGKKNETPFAGAEVVSRNALYPVLYTASSEMSPKGSK